MCVSVCPPRKDGGDDVCMCELMCTKYDTCWFAYLLIFRQKTCNLETPALPRRRRSSPQRLDERRTYTPSRAAAPSIGQRQSATRLSIPRCLQLLHASTKHYCCTSCALILPNPSLSEIHRRAHGAQIPGVCVCAWFYTHTCIFQT